MRLIKNTIFTIMIGIFICIIPVKAEESAILINDFRNDIPDVIHSYVNAINEQDWDAYVKTNSPQIQELYVDFPSAYLVENRCGILSVDSISIYEAKKLPEEHILEIEPHFEEIDYSAYSNIEYYYIGFLYEVCKESEFFYNGVKYALVAVGTLEDVQYIVGYEHMYSLEKLEKFGYTFNSEAESKAQNVNDQREKGVIVNFKNDVLEYRVQNSDEHKVREYDVDITDSEDNSRLGTEEIKGVILSEEDKIVKENLEKASQWKDVVSTRSMTSPPSTLKLYRTDIGKSVTLGFDEYAKCVLPNEWMGSWESEALKAGAVAIKTYAWYNVENPRKPATDYGCHLTDRYQNYQNYVANSNYPTTDDAVDAVSGVFMRNSNGVVFEAAHGRGTEGEAGTAWTGWMSQYGSQHIALTFPEYEYDVILSYYYSYSDVSEGLIQVGKY